MHLERIHEMLEDLTECTLSAMKEGKTCVGKYPISEVTDMIKDLASAEYHCTITHAMKKSDEEKEEEEKYMLRQMKEEYGDNAQKYYNEWRYANGRYAPKGRGTRNYPYNRMPDLEPEHMRDLDRVNGKMYYTPMTDGKTYSDGYSDGDRDGYNRGYSEGKMNNRESRYDMARRGYEDSKTMHAGNTAEDNNANVRKIEEMMDVISEDMKELLPKMTPSEKTALKSRMQTLTTHIS